MTDLQRLSLSMEPDLLEQLDQRVLAAAAANRSEYVRSLLREHFNAEKLDADAGAVVATITLVYDHHAKGLNDRLVRIQHDADAEVVVTTHLHLDHHRCLEILVVRGGAEAIHNLESRLRQLKGIDRVSAAIAGLSSNG